MYYIVRSSITYLEVLEVLDFYSVVEFVAEEYVYVAEEYVYVALHN